MKRVYLAIFLLIICASLCVFEQYTVESTYQNACEYIDTARAYVENNDFENAEKSCSKLTSYWQKKYPYLSAMIDHSLLDEASASIYSLENSAEDKSDNLAEDLTLAENQIKIIRDNQKITFGNIF